MRGIEVSEVRIKLASDPDEKLLAYCSVTLNNAIVIKDLKIIQGEATPFVAMPSRKITDKCGKCGCTISTTVTGRQRVSDGWRCDNCYFDELGEFVEQNPIGGHLRR
jgi:hypothetical protein